MLKGTRTPAHCLGRWMLLNDAAPGDAAAKVPWTTKEDADLQEAIDEHGAGNWGTSALSKTIVPGVILY